MAELRWLSRHAQQSGRPNAGLANDLNNILTVIVANAQLIESILPPDRLEERLALAEIERAALRGAELAARLVALEAGPPAKGASSAEAAVPDAPAAAGAVPQDPR